MGWGKAGTASVLPLRRACFTLATISDRAGPVIACSFGAAVSIFPLIFLAWRLLPLFFSCCLQENRRGLHWTAPFG